MAKSSKSKSSLAQVLIQIERQYGDGSIGFYNSGRVAEIDSIPTGSIGLDIATGIGGFPRGRIVEIYGQESSGKTTLTLHTIAQAQKLGQCAFIDVEHALDPSYAAALGVDMEKLLISQPDFGEQALNIVESLVDSGELVCIIVDSVAALIPKAELEGEIEDATIGLMARMMSKTLRKLVAKVSKSNTLVIFINQLRDKIGGFGGWGGPQHTTTGGNALKFYCSMRVEVKRIGSQKDSKDKEVIANKTEAKVVKNKMAPPYKKAEFQIRFGEGIDRVNELMEFCLDLKYIKQRGSFYSISEKQIGQGKEEVRNWLIAHPAVIEKLEKKITGK